MVVTETRVGGQPVLVARPDGSSMGSLSIDMAGVLGRAHRSAAACCFLRPVPLAHEPLFNLVSDDVRRIEPGGGGERWLRLRWALSAARATLAGWSSAAGESFWREWYRELRRHIGDERLPYPLRLRLRARADRALDRSTRHGSRRAARPFPRRLLRERVPMTLRPDRLAAAERIALQHGIPVGSPIVGLQCQSRVNLVHDAVDALNAAGYTVVRFGSPGSGALTRGALIDLTTQDTVPELDLYVLLKSAFVVCDSADVQHTTYLTGTPCLRLNAIEPFSAYPVRRDGLFTLAKAVELDSGRILSLDELHGETYLKHPDHYAHVPHDARQVLDAVREMVDGVRHEWAEQQAQADYRERVGEAARSLQARVPLVRRWGVDGGFLGDGRLARVQAQAASSPSPPSHPRTGDEQVAR